MVARDGTTKAQRLLPRGLGGGLNTDLGGKPCFAEKSVLKKKHLAGFVCSPFNFSCHSMLTIRSGGLSWCTRLAHYWNIMGISPYSYNSIQKNPNKPLPLAQAVTWHIQGTWVTQGPFSWRRHPGKGEDTAHSEHQAPGHSRRNHFIAYILPMNQYRFLNTLVHSKILYWI